MKNKTKAVISNVGIRSGAVCTCQVCGYHGHCYGAPTGAGVTPPFCYRCGSHQILEDGKEPVPAPSTGILSSLKRSIQKLCGRTS